MEERYIVSKKEAVQIMKKALKQIEEGDEDSVFVLTLNLEGKGYSGLGNYISIKNGEQIIESSKTRIFSGNRYMSQLDLYSAFQSDITNIKHEGVLKTILLPGI